MLVFGFAKIFHHATKVLKVSRWHGRAPGKGGLGGGHQAGVAEGGETAVAYAVLGCHPVQEGGDARQETDERLYGLVPDGTPQDQRPPTGAAQRRDQQATRAPLEEPQRRPTAAFRRGGRPPEIPPPDRVPRL